MSGGCPRGLGLREEGDEAVEAGGVFRYFVGGEGREVVMEVDGIELYGCQRTLVRVAGGARWAIEWEIVCIDQKRIRDEIGESREQTESEELRGDYKAARNSDLIEDSVAMNKRDRE